MTKPTVFEFSILASDTCSSGKKLDSELEVKGWSIYAKKQFEQSNCMVAIYNNPGTNTYVIGIAVAPYTDFSTLNTDVDPLFYSDAYNYIQNQVNGFNRNGKNIYLTGHSYGALLAEVIALSLSPKCRAITFESPGSLPWVKRHCQEANIRKQHISTYIVTHYQDNNQQVEIHDYVNRLFDHAGKVYSLCVTLDKKCETEIDTLRSKPGDSETQSKNKFIAELVEANALHSLDNIKLALQSSSEINAFPEVTRSSGQALSLDDVQWLLEDSTGVQIGVITAWINDRSLKEHLGVHGMLIYALQKNLGFSTSSQQQENLEAYLTTLEQGIDEKDKPAFTAAKKGLGFHEGQQIRAFALTDSDIRVDAPFSIWHLGQQSESSSETEKSDLTVGISSSIKNKIVSSPSFNFKRTTKKKTKTNNHELSLTVAKVCKCNIQKATSKLIQEGRELEHGPGRFIRSGALVKGYTIKALLSTRIDKDDWGMLASAGLGMFAQLIKLNGTYERSRKQKNTHGEISIQFETIGGYAPPKMMHIDVENCLTEIEKINEHFLSQYEQSSWHFTYDQEDLIAYEVDSNHQALLDIYHEINEKIETAPIQDQDFLEIFKRKLEVHFTENNIKKLHSSRQSRETKMLFKEMARVLYQVVCGIEAFRLIFTDISTPITYTFQLQGQKTGRSKYYLATNQDHSSLALRTKKESFTLVHANSSVFFLMNSEQRYLTIVSNDGKYELQLTYDKGQAARCYFENVDERRGVYNLIANTRAVSCVKARNYFKLSITYIGAEGLLQISPFTNQYATWEAKIDRIMRFTKKEKTALQAESDALIREADRPSYELPAQQQGSTLSSHEREAVMRFLIDIVPKLKAAEDNNLALVMGIMGSGKSTFINYMLGHRFKYDYDNLSGERKLVLENPTVQGTATMGDRLTLGVTRFPEVFSSPASKGFAFCDTPGLQDSIDERTHYSMFLVKEMAKTIRSFIVVIDKSCLTTSRAKGFSDLLKTIDSISSITDLLQNGKLLFIYNTKDSKAKNIFLLIKQYIKEINDEIRPIETAEDNCKKQAEKHSLKSQLTTVVKSLLTNLSKTVEVQKAQAGLTEDEYQSRRIIREVLGQLNGTNTIIWNSALTGDCRDVVLYHLNEEGMTAGIDKSKIYCYSNSAKTSAFEQSLDLWVKEADNKLALLLSERNRLKDIISTLKDEITDNFEMELDEFDKRIKGTVNPTAEVRERKGFIKCLKEFDELVEYQTFCTIAKDVNFGRGFIAFFKWGHKNWGKIKTNIDKYNKEGKPPIAKHDIEHNIECKSGKLALESLDIPSSRRKITATYVKQGKFQGTHRHFAGKVYGLKLHDIVEQNNYIVNLKNILSFCEILNEYMRQSWFNRIPYVKQKISSIDHLLLSLPKVIEKLKLHPSAVGDYDMQNFINTPFSYMRIALTFGGLIESASDIAYKNREAGHNEIKVIMHQISEALKNLRQHIKTEFQNNPLLRNAIYEQRREEHSASIKERAEEIERLKQEQLKLEKEIWRHRQYFENVYLYILPLYRIFKRKKYMNGKLTKVKFSEFIKRYHQTYYYKPHEVRVESAQKLLLALNNEGWQLSHIEQKHNGFYNAVMDQIQKVRLKPSQLQLQHLKAMCNKYKVFVKEDYLKVADVLEVILAVYELSKPWQGFICYYYNTVGMSVRNTSTMLRLPALPVIKLAIVNNCHYSVHAHPSLNVGAIREVHSDAQQTSDTVESLSINTTSLVLGSDMLLKSLKKIIFRGIGFYAKKMYAVNINSKLRIVFKDHYTPVPAVIKKKNKHIQQAYNIFKDTLLSTETYNSQIKQENYNEPVTSSSTHSGKRRKVTKSGSTIPVAGNSYSQVQLEMKKNPEGLVKEIVLASDVYTINCLFQKFEETHQLLGNKGYILSTVNTKGSEDTLECRIS